MKAAAQIQRRREDLHDEADALRRQAEVCIKLADRERLHKEARRRDVQAEADRWARSSGLSQPK